MDKVDKAQPRWTSGGQGPATVDMSGGQGGQGPATVNICSVCVCVCVCLRARMRVCVCFCFLLVIQWDILRTLYLSKTAAKITTSILGETTLKN